MTSPALPHHKPEGLRSLSYIQVQGRTFLSPILVVQLATLLHLDTPSALAQARVLNHRQKPESPASHSLCIPSPPRVSQWSLVLSQSFTEQQNKAGASAECHHPKAPTWDRPTLMGLTETPPPKGALPNGGASIHPDFEAKITNQRLEPC